MIGRFEPAGDPVSMAQFEQLRDVAFEVSLGDVPENLHVVNEAFCSFDQDGPNDGTSSVVRDFSVEWQRYDQGDEHLKININETILLQRGVASITRDYDLQVARKDENVQGRTELLCGGTVADKDALGSVESSVTDGRVALFLDWFGLESMLNPRHRELIGGDIPFILREVKSFAPILNKVNQRRF